MQIKGESLDKCQQQLAAIVSDNIRKQLGLELKNIAVSDNSSLFIVYIIFTLELLNFLKVS